MAAVGGVVAVIAGAAALTPGALASTAGHKCANKVVTINLPGAVGSEPRTFKTTVKEISTNGVSCAAAYKFISLQYKQGTRVVPEGYKCTTGHFKTPLGYVPQVCTRRGAKIQYAAQGG
jgi:hypothetical protein